MSTKCRMFSVPVSFSIQSRHVLPKLSYVQQKKQNKDSLKQIKQKREKCQNVLNGIKMEK